jgi:hypothetical protein
MRFERLLYAFFVVSGIYSSTAKATQPTHLFAFTPNRIVNVWEEQGALPGACVITTSNDTLIIDSIYFNLNRSCPQAKQITLGTVCPGSLTADSSYSISFPNSNYGVPGTSKKIALLPSDFAYLYNWNFTYSNANVGDTLAVLLYFKFSRHFLDSVMHGVDSLLVRKIASSTSAVSMLPVCMQSQGQITTKDRFNLLGRRMHRMTNRQVFRREPYVVITNSHDPKKNLDVGN